MKPKAWSLALFFATAAMLTWAASAGAGDGVIEINQAKVLAAGGFPYTISGAGSYRLTGNLSVSGSHDGIDVFASSVTIDLNGFSIGGPGTGSGNDGIVTGAAPTTALTVKNGTITSFTRGLNLETGTGSTVTNIHVNGDGWGILVGSNSVIENSVSTSNTDNGLECTGSNCTISGNTANSNLNFGIYCLGGSCAISHNTVNGNSNVGIDCGAAGCVVSGNTANGDNSGILVTGASVVIGNTMESNTSNGFVGASTDGYGENVMSGNPGGNASGGKSMGNNVCSGALC
jgi:parallel beta-helix repeat protein